MTVAKNRMLFVLLGLVPLSVDAQDTETPQRYSYVTYYVCDVATQGNMDNVVATNEYAVFDKWVEEGKLISWGYLSHFTGGRWRRAQYHVSATLEDALNSQNSIFREIYSGNRTGGQARSEACETHDDYIWAFNQGSAAGTDRGDVSLSVYFVCNVADQMRADEIFRQTFAPRYDKLQQDGKIGSWGWQSHVLGGEYRRLLTVTGDSYADVVTARENTLQFVNQNHSALGREFAQICNAHTDYLWDIVHETP